MKTIKVEVHEEKDIRDFLDKLLTNMKHDKVKDILRMTEAGVCFDGERTADTIKHLKENFTSLAETHLAASKWFAEAMSQGLFPLQDSKDEIDPVAISEANQKPKQHGGDGDGDTFMDDYS